MPLPPSPSAEADVGPKVLVITNTFPTPEHPHHTPCIAEQMEALGERGVHLDLLHIATGSRRSYLGAAAHALSLAARRRRYDLVHAHYGASGLVARLAVTLPLVVTFHGSDLLSRREGVIGRLVSRLAGQVIVMTEEMRRASGRSDARIIPFGVDTRVFRPGPRDLARAELGWPLDRPVVLFPWDPTRPVKRFALAREAVEQLRADLPGVRLVPFHGAPREAIARAMQAADVMVVSSAYEGSPMAVREAMACDLPVISVDVGDVARVIAGSRGCALCMPQPSDMAAKLLSTLRRGVRGDGSQLAHRYGRDQAALRVLEVYRLALARR